MTPKLITRKSDMAPIVANLCQQKFPEQATSFWQALQDEVLDHKVKFPLLEYLARELYRSFSDDAQQAILFGLRGRSEAGSSVIAGKLLQLQTPNFLERAFAETINIIIDGDTWYHCDHVGERVFGHSLLTHFEETMPYLTGYLQHENEWVRRSVGVAGHYATKKGLSAANVERLLVLLLTAASSRNYQEQRGIGWGLKTIGKFHPQLMQEALRTKPAVSAPIMSKINTGLAIARKRAMNA